MPDSACAARRGRNEEGAHRKTLAGDFYDAKQHGVALVIVARFMIADIVRAGRWERARTGLSRP